MYHHVIAYIILLLLFPSRLVVVVLYFYNNICGRYGDAVKELDYGVGEILNTLESFDVEEETLVIFSSDNGAATYAKENGSRNSAHHDYIQLL